MSEQSLYENWKDDHHGRVLIMRFSEILLCIAYCFATATTHFSLDKKTVGEYSDVHIMHK
jgi:hypothetical protein